MKLYHLFKPSTFYRVDKKALLDTDAIQIPGDRNWFTLNKVIIVVKNTRTIIYHYAGIDKYIYDFY